MSNDDNWIKTTKTTETTKKHVKCGAGYSYILALSDGEAFRYLKDESRLEQLVWDMLPRSGWKEKFRCGSRCAPVSLMVHGSLLLSLEHFAQADPSP